MNKFGAKVVWVDGYRFDSITESVFYKRNKNHYKRNDQSFVVWKCKYTNTEISYTPDFVSADGNTWVEIKSEATMTAEYMLRKKLVEHYCIDNGILFLEFVFFQDRFITLSEKKLIKLESSGAAADVIKELDNLWNKRKTLKDEEFDRIYELLHSNKLQHIRKGRYLARKKAFTALKNKLKVKAPIDKLKALHKEKQNSI